MVAVIVPFDLTTNLLQRRYQIGCGLGAIAMNGAPTGHSKSDFLNNLRLSGCRIADLRCVLLVGLLLLVSLLLRIQV